ncbi:hypothetical protein RUND412_008580, partial [Rhizina undulata]
MLIQREFLAVGVASDANFAAVKGVNEHEKTDLGLFVDSFVHQAAYWLPAEIKRVH